MILTILDITYKYIDFYLCLLICVLSILVIFPFLMASIKNKINMMTIVLFILTVIGGCIVYLLAYYPKEKNLETAYYLNLIIRTILSTGRMFVIENDYENINKQLQQNIYYLIVFWTCHVTALIIVVMTVFSLFGQKILEKLKIIISYFKEKYILYGINEFSLSLAKNIIKNNKQRIIFFFDDEYDENINCNISDKMINEIKTLGFVIINSNIFAPNLSILNKIFTKILFKKLFIFLFKENEIFNFNIFTDITKSINKYNINKNNIKGIYIKVKSNFIHTEIDEYIKESNLKYNITIFSEADLVSRKFIEKYPLYKKLKFDNNTCKVISPDKIKILLLGFGDVGEQIIQKIIYNFQFINCKLELYIIDKNSNNKSGQYIFDNPCLFDNTIDYIDIDFVDYNVKSKNFYNFLLNENLNFDYIISVLGNDKLNLETLSSIKNLLFRMKIEKKVHLIAYLKDNNYEYFKDKNSALKNIDIFGYFKNIFTENVIINQELDLLAMAINKCYDDKNWNELSMHLKNSNRATALFLQTFLHIMGYKLEFEINLQPTDLKIDTKEKFDLIIEKLKSSNGLETLAKIEHLRWNAFHFSNGWIPKPLDELTDRESRSNEYNKTHACLVKWDKLINVEEKIKSYLQNELNNNRISLSEYENEIDKCVFNKHDTENIIHLFDFIDMYNKDNKNNKKVIIKLNDT